MELGPCFETLPLILLAFKTGGVQADEIETAQSWDHFREIMISEGTSQAGLMRKRAALAPGADRNRRLPPKNRPRWPAEYGAIGASC